MPTTPIKLDETNLYQPFLIVVALQPITIAGTQMEGFSYLDGLTAYLTATDFKKWLDWMESFHNSTRNSNPQT